METNLSPMLAFVVSVEQKSLKAYKVERYPRQLPWLALVMLFHLVLKITLILKEDLPVQNIGGGSYLWLSWRLD